MSFKKQIGLLLLMELFYQFLGFFAIGIYMKLFFMGILLILLTNKVESHEGIAKKTLFIAMVLYYVNYITIRLITSAMMIPFTKEFGLNATSWAYFISYFSLGYGVFQIFSGFLVNRWKLNTMAIFTIFCGLCLWGLSYSVNFATCLQWRFLMGIFCSTGQIGVSYYFSQYIPKNQFKFIFASAFYMGSKITVLICNLNEKFIINEIISWRIFAKYLGTCSILLGFVIFILYNYCHNDLYIKNYNESPSKSLKINREIIYLCLLSWFSVVIFYALQTGFLEYLFMDKFPSIAPNYGKFLLNEVFSMFALFLPAILDKFGYYKSIIFMNIAQIIGVILLLIYYNNFIVISIALTLIAVGDRVHSICPMIAGDKYRHNNVALLFGLFNFFAMIFGCAITQYFSGYLMDFYGSKPYLSGHVIGMVLYLFPFVIFSLIVSFLLHRKYK